MAVFLALSVLTGAACGPTYYDFSYRPNELETATRSDFKIAVIPFVDQRETYDRGSTAWAWLPLVLWATERNDASDDSRDRRAGEYYFPEIIAYAIALDLAGNGIGERVDIAPTALEDYDLIVHGTIQSTAQYDRKLSYGLGPLSFITAWVGAPQAARGVAFDASYVVYDARGDIVIERTVEEAWSTYFMSETQAAPHMHGVVTTLREANQSFLEELVLALEDPPLAPEAAAIDERLRLYHYRLDPELAALVSQRDEARSREGALYAEFADVLHREIVRRARYLEAYRRTEGRIIGEQQEFVWATQHRQLVETAKVRATQRDIRARQEQLEREQFHATMRPLAGAVVAGVTPAYGQAAGAGRWNQQHMQDLTLDLGAALSAMPPPPPPPPDLTPMLRELEISTRGREAPGALIAELEGNNIPELRRNFLELYGRKTRSLDELKRDHLSENDR